MPRDASYRDSFATWLTWHGAAHRSLPDLLDGFCRFLNAEGYLIKRCNLATETVHPLMTSTRHVWFSSMTDPGAIDPTVVVDRRQYQLGEALIDEVFFYAGSEETHQYVASPFYKITKIGELYETIRPVGDDQTFPVFHDLAAIGCTAYYGLKLNNFSGMLQKVGLASARPGGLSPQQVQDLRWSLSLLTLHVNTLIEFAIKTTLSRVYVGRDPGQRVCDGMVALGAVVSLDSAIWFSDLRGFTQISEGLSPEELIVSLNTYFEGVVGTIYEHGGEVLKYIGDAILAVFPVEKFDDRHQACAAALAAVNASTTRLAEMNAERGKQGLPLFHHGVGLHFGAAKYGNIGSKERLDFTVIGREVNIASRIEGKCKELQEPVLASGAFASNSSLPMKALGPHKLKGIAGEMPLYALIDLCLLSTQKRTAREPWLHGKTKDASCALG